MAEVEEHNDNRSDGGGNDDGVDHHNNCGDVLLQIASDLHLERPDVKVSLSKLSGTTTTPPTSGYERCHHVLGLLGDIGNPKSLNKTYGPFIAEQANKGFDNVLLVSGNHEYYANVSVEDTNQLIETACSEAESKSSTKTKVTFMWRKKVEIGDFIFLGTGLTDLSPTATHSLTTRQINQLPQVLHYGLTSSLTTRL